MNIGYLVDTDWAIHWLNGQDRIRKRLEELKEHGLALSAISLAELYEGVCYSRSLEASERMLSDFLKGVSLLGINEDTCKLFGRERGRLRQSKRSIGDFDLLIGATALRYGLILLSNNRKHFEQIEGLRMESIPSPSAPSTE